MISGKPVTVADIGHRQARHLERLGSAARRDKLDAAAVKRAREVDEPVLSDTDRKARVMGRR